jgi:predicted nucleic acid-binding protein
VSSARLIGAGEPAVVRIRADLLIAAVALANALPLLTRHAADFAGLDDLIDIVEI